ncbi:MAG TPA: efflux RND transporter permease subunit, partial [Candidatus Eremiobacteraceae bacterium]|nr:efflux RND transporter permease subunit [Candidatus Eremiobacteraceae bacterium]
GTVTPSFQVTVDPVALQGAGFTVDDVVNTIAANNTREPGGIIYQPGRETLVDVRGDIQTPAQVANLPLQVQGLTPATNAPELNPWSVSQDVPRIGDFATVTDANEVQRVFAYVNGAPEVFIQIQKTTSANEVTTSDNVLAALPKIKAQYPALDFTVVNVQSKYTRQQLAGVLHTLLEGVTLTAIVMLFFLGSWRNAIVVFISIPTSLLITLAVMKLSNFTIDTISLLAMTLVVGILVDDSIVVLENIQRHFHDGEKPLNAAVTGRSEIGFAAIVITMVDVVVFLPIAFLPGIVGEFMREFAICVVVATLTSLFVSFTITPTLAGRWSLLSTWKPWRPIQAFESGFERLRNWYAETVLPAGLRKPLTVAGIAAASVLVAIVLVASGAVGFTFIPPVDRGEIYIQITYPSGTPLTTMQATVLGVNGQMSKISDIGAFTSTAGAYSSPFGGFISQANVGQVHLFLKDDRKHSTDYWVDYLRKNVHIPGADVVIIPATATGGGNTQPIDYLVTATTGNVAVFAQQVYQALKATPGTANVTSSAQSLTPQVEVVFDRQAAQALDVSIGAASTAIRAALGGTVATQFESVNGLKDVQVIFPVQDQTSLDEIKAIAVRADNGAIAHVGDVATLQWSPALPVITRVNRQTVVHITSNVTPGFALSNVQNAFMKKVAALHLPGTISVRSNPNGNQQNLIDLVTGVGAALALSYLVVYLLMVALYNGYITPFIIMFAVPVAAVGAFGALAITGQTLNLFSLIGVVMLVGLVSKNGILLVDYANTLRTRGYGKLEAIRQSARIRFRPIIMTTCAMIAGMTPLALGLVEGSQVRQALGIVVIGGLTSSLLLTLVLVPVAYVWLAPDRLVLEPELLETPPVKPREDHEFTRGGVEVGQRTK